MKNISNLTQPEVDPFDAPVPGQSLTDEPGNYPWEHAPQHSDPEEVLDLLFDKLGQTLAAQKTLDEMLKDTRLMQYDAYDDAMQLRRVN